MEKRRTPPSDAVECTCPIQGNPNDAALLREGLQNCLADPPHRIADELDAFGLVELMGGADETEVALIDEIGKRHPLVLILLRHRHHEPEVGADQLVERLLFPTLDTLRKARLFSLVDQRILADLFEVLVKRSFPESAFTGSKPHLTLDVKHVYYWRDRRDGQQQAQNMISKGIIPQQPREEGAPTAASPDVGLQARTRALGQRID